MKKISHNFSGGYLFVVEFACFNNDGPNHTSTEIRLFVLCLLKMPFLFILIFKIIYIYINLLICLFNYLLVYLSIARK